MSEEHQTFLTGRNAVWKDLDVYPPSRPSSTAAMNQGLLNLGLLLVSPLVIASYLHPEEGRRRPCAADMWWCAPPHTCVWHVQEEVHVWGGGGVVS